MNLRLTIVVGGFLADMNCSCRGDIPISNLNIGALELTWNDNYGHISYE
jgi:hypothetical protein